MIDGIVAVVVNWNGGEENLACIASLVADGIAPERIVFVDNASHDGSFERVCASYPGLRALRNERNLGYGHACNRGIELALAAGAPAVFLVNNDLTLEPGGLARLVHALSDARVGIVGPRIVLDPDRKTLWAAGGRMTWRANLSELRGHGAPDHLRWRKQHPVDYVPGAAMLVRRGVFEAIGALDGEFFAYHEDVDFCLRARKAGFVVLIAGGALAYHKAHHSTGGGYNARRKYMMGVNTMRFMRKHGTGGRWVSVFVFDVLTLPFAWVRRALRGEGSGVRAKALGLWHGVLGRRVTEEALERLG